MKLLVATADTQGKRKNDFNWCNEGEILIFAVECDGEKVDGPCGCKRSLSGLDSHKATTTFKAVNVPITEAELLQKLIDHWTKNWSFTQDEAEEQATDDIKELRRLAEHFPDFAIIERRGRTFRVREVRNA